MNTNTLIELRDLKTYFYTEDGVVKAVDGVSFSIERQKTLGVVGESGCGKSVTALSIMGLVPQPPGKIVGGSIVYWRNGQPIELTKLDPKGKEYRSIRGNEIAMIFQEPMTSLNPLDLIRKLQREFHMALMMITHNLGVIAEMADDVVIMYMGKVVEEAPVRQIYRTPTHPYTIGLMESIPALTRKKERLKPIKGMVPDPYNLPKGCPFEPRCPEAMEICREQMPPLREIRPQHRVACWARFSG
jgi:oligopeptide/dipeptide ABC transporter ATP-binding protein